MPVEYITGRVEFCDQVFKISQDVLIPRVETEELVHLAVEILTKKYQSPYQIADVGTGCGAVGISLAHQLHDDQLQIWMSDVSPTAISVAQTNWKLLRPRSQSHHIFVSDLLSTYPPSIKLQLITANLPYIPTSRIPALPASVHEYEPHLALAGGEDGLYYIRKLIEQAPPYLDDGATILLEVDYLHTLDVLQSELSLEHFNLQVHFDQFSRTRFAQLTYTG